MRILMLTQFYPPVIGGEEQHVRSLSAALVKRGHQVTVATQWLDGTPEFETDQGVNIQRIRGTVQRLPWLFSESQRRFAPPLPDPELGLALHRIMQKERPDVVHAHNWLIHSFLPLKATSHTPLVLTLHDYSLVCAKKRLMYRHAPCSGPRFSKCLACATDHYGWVKGVPTLFANRVMAFVENSAVDLFLPVSQAVADGNQLAASGLAFRVTPNFVPDHINVLESDGEPYASQLPPGDFLLFVGDLSTEKGVDVLIQAYAQCAGAPPLVLIGRAGATTPKQLPANVIVLNNLPHAAVMVAWSRCLFGFAPSVWPDPCPTVAMEAMAMGKPLIASRIGGLIDIVADGETGLLVAPGDVTALVVALKQLLNDAPQRSRMAQAAVRRVVEFQACRVVPRIEQCYRDVLAKPSTANAEPLPVNLD